MMIMELRRCSTSAGIEASPPAIAPASDAQGLEGRVRSWLTAYIAAQLGMPADRVDASVPFDCYGFGSIELTAMAIDLEQWWGRPISRSVLAAHPTIDTMASYLAGGGS